MERIDKDLIRSGMGDDIVSMNKLTKEEVLIKDQFYMTVLKDSGHYATHWSQIVITESSSKTCLFGEVFTRMSLESP